MDKNNEQLAQFLLDAGLLSEKDIQEAREKAKDSAQWPSELVIANKISDEELRKAIAYVNGIPFVNLENVFVSKNVLRIIPESIAKKNNIVAFEKNEGRIKVAMLNPDDLPVIDFIRKKTESRIIPCLTSQKSIQKVLNQYQKSLEAEFGEIIEKNSQTALTKSAGKKDLKEIASDLPIVKIIDTLIKHAVLQQASDIHIEPSEEEVYIRYRIDGILHDIMALPGQIMPFLAARIKVLSNLKLDEHRLPQDGRFKIKQDSLNISFRVSIIPVYGGEKIVMRLLDESSKGLTLEKIGLEGESLERVQRAIRKPNGMLLVSGPTGSGKTTTLYTVMDIINSKEVNINTIEDPIEYRMQRINQTQVNPKIGLTFSIGLRALLRQDPDIIMVGEIRDAETATIAAHAAMTGHLVLSTVHTNSAAGAFPRLIDMEVESFLVASTINLVIGQRLVRKVCSFCAESHKLSKEEVSSLGKMIDIGKLIETIKEDPEVKGKIKSVSDLIFHKGKGCERCLDSGYKGRMGIFEVLEVDEEIAKLINKQSSTDEIEQVARAKGMRTMLEDGFKKAVRGLTTLEEILRVTKE